jgi:protein transport protein SEC24
MRPAPPAQQGPSGASMNVNRPPMNGVRPPLPSVQTSSNSVPSTVRPPFPQFPSAQGVKPHIPQLVPNQFANPSAQNLTPILNRPPMPPQTPQNLPAMRPPIPILNNIQGSRPPIMQNSQSSAPLRPPQIPQRPQINAPLRPSMPQSHQVNGPLTRPPSASQPQISRPPPMPLRPPVPNSQPTSISARPSMPVVSSTRPPMTTSQTQMPPQMHTRPPMPMPGNPGLNQSINQMPLNQAAPTGSQIPAMKSPSMRYPVGPGYVQQQQPPVYPAMQQPSTFPQTMPPTQQHYPSFTQASNPQNAPQYPSNSYSGGSLAPQQPPAPKVNPAAIPSVVAVLENDELRFKETGQPFYTFSSVVDNPPPLPTTRSVSIIDDGNSSPQFIRSTLNHIPISEEICENTKIPLSLLIQPFASSPQTDVPLVDFGAAGPLRCNRCRAYVNAHVRFIKGGRFYVCNLCDMSNAVPDEYYANLDMSGKRIDLDLRPELKYGTVDFVATKVKTSKFIKLFCNNSIFRNI